MSDAPTFDNVPQILLWRVSQSPNDLAFEYPDDKEVWRKVTWQDFGQRVRVVASGLRALGIADEQRVAILSETSLPWIVADMAILAAGAATTTIYPNSPADECAYIISDSDTRIVFAQNDAQVKKLLEVREQIPSVQTIVVMDGTATDDGFVITQGDLEARGKAYDDKDPASYEANIARIKLDWLATLIYTSGTTGKPKGVELTHDCWVYEAEAIHALNMWGPSDKQFLWLPLSHSFGKVLEVAVLRSNLPTAVDGRIPKIVENLGVVKPTVMAAAPRIFEKIYNNVVTGAKAGGGMKFRIFQWAVGVGGQVSKLRQEGQEPGFFLGMQYSLATRLVFSKLQERLGGNIRFFVSGSAPLSREMAEFFHAAGILILEGYGLTETSAASFVNRPDGFRFGTVGQPLPGTQVQIAKEDGEILLKGRGVMRGYHNLPEETAATLKDGWLLTGDIGELDADGRLKITDRKKNLIKTSGGKYVAPQHIESKLKARCPYLSQVLVHGDRRNFCSALVTLDPDSIAKWAKENGLEGASYESLTSNDAVKTMVQQAVDEMNKELARYETIKRFAVLPRDFTVEGGELTASLKVKRKVVETMYADTLEGFYAGAFAD